MYGSLRNYEKLASEINIPQIICLNISRKRETKVSGIMIVIILFNTITTVGLSQNRYLKSFDAVSARNKRINESENFPRRKK